MSNHNRNYSQAYNNKRSLLDIIHKNDPIKIKIIKPRDDWNSKNFSDYTNNINPFNIANSNSQLGMGKPLSMYSNTKIFQVEQKESCMEKINLKIIKNYHTTFMKEKNKKFNNDYINTLVSLLKRKDKGYNKIRMLLSNKEDQEDDLSKLLLLTPNDKSVKSPRINLNSNLKDENGPIAENVSEYSRTNKASKSNINEEINFLENKNQDCSNIEQEINKKILEYENPKKLLFQSSKSKSYPIQSESVANLNEELIEGNSNIIKIENKSSKLIPNDVQTNKNVNKELVNIENKENITNKDGFGKQVNFMGLESSNPQKLKSEVNKILRNYTKSYDFGNNQELKLKSILKSIKAEEEQKTKIHKYFQYFEDPKIQKEYEFKIEKRFYIKKETEDTKIKMLKKKEERLDKLFSKQLDYSKILKENLDILKCKFTKQINNNLESAKHIDYANPKKYYNFNSPEKDYGNNCTETNLAINSDYYNSNNNFNRTSKNTWNGFNKTRTEKSKRNYNLLSNPTDSNKDGEERIQFSKESESKINKQNFSPSGPTFDYTNSKFDNFLNTTKNSNTMGICNFSPWIKKENVGNNAKSSKNCDLIAQYGKRDKNIFIPVVQRKELYSSPKRDMFSLI